MTSTDASGGHCLTESRKGRMILQLQVPESVAAYAHDPAIEATVDGLISAREKLLPDLRWSEMAAYYKAWTAAQSG